jgi:histidinol-phosphatase (PHP family)
MESSCLAAIAAGVTEIAFTDHVDHVPADPGYGFYRPDEYLREVDRIRDQFSGELTVLRGAEIDYNEGTTDVVERFVADYGGEFDFVIGSVHYAADGAMIFPDYFGPRTMDDVFLPYLDQVQKAVETGWFDVIGHLDLPKRYAPKTHRDYDPARYRERLEPIFDAMIERGVGFEINTSGLRQTPKTSMPGPAVVRWYADPRETSHAGADRQTAAGGGLRRASQDAPETRADGPAKSGRDPARRGQDRGPQVGRSMRRRPRARDWSSIKQRDALPRCS